jgi:hypothetical protein
LDSTLFDNRPRQARIVREFGQAQGLTELLICQSEHFDSGWDMKAAMRNCGLAPERIEQVFDAARRFWAERFFTSDYCLDDVPIPGSADFLRQVMSTQAQLCYVTGRHEAMRAGTVGALQRAQMPIPGERVELLMKPTFDLHDDEYKRLAHRRLSELGTLVAAFDNEPTHANDYRRAFPQAKVIHLATDHSGRPVELLAEVVSVPHFDITARQSGN